MPIIIEESWEGIHKGLPTDQILEKGSLLEMDGEMLSHVDNMKQAMSSDPVLTFLNVTKLSKVQTDVSNFTLA